MKSKRQGVMIRSKGRIFEEGEIYYKWENSRINNNKNIISVTTGATGSGKSMCDLRRAELSYKKRFGKQFPVDTNVCFSITDLMRVISSGKLRKGDIIILEEAGFNAGSQDWQNKATKMFNYLLQTFRSMNICLYMNLPVLSMLAKQARQLIHIHFETQGIDFENKMVKVKPLVHQLNQQSGKSYWKFLRVLFKLKVRAVKRMKFGLPSKTLRDKYEAKKSLFLYNMTEDFSKDLLSKEEKKRQKATKLDLTDQQKDVYLMLCKGIKVKEIAKIKDVHPSTIYDIKKAILRKGFIIKPLGK